MREEFEKWAKSEGYDPSVRKMLSSYPPKDGGYADSRLNSLWKCWKASNSGENSKIQDLETPNE